MKYLVSGFLDVLNEILSNIMQIFTGSFWKDLGISQGLSWKENLLTVGGKFDAWFPGVMQLRTAFFWIGMFFVLLLFFTGLLKAFLPEGVAETAEHPFTVIGRTIGAAFAVAWAFQIMYLLQYPMATIFDGIYQLGAGGTAKAPTTPGLLPDFNGDGVGNVSSIKIKDKEDQDLIEDIGGFAMLIIMSFAVTWMYIKLILEMVERYVTTCFLFYVSPLAFSTIASKSTNGIAVNFIRMLFAQYLLIMFNCIFLFVFCFAYSNMGKNEFASINEVVIFFAALMAWLKLGQRLDEHMNTLGLGAARTGAGLGGELFAAAGLAWGSMKLAGNTIRNGGALGKGLATGKASEKTAGGRLGNLGNAGVKKAAATAPGNAAYNKAADLMGRPEGIKGDAFAAGAGLLAGNKSIAEAAAGPRVTTGAAALAAMNQGMTLSDGSNPTFESAQIGNGHMTGTAGGQTYDFVPREGKALTGAALSVTGPDGKEWVASLMDDNGKVREGKLDTDFARQALGADGMNSYLNNKFGGHGFGLSGEPAGLYQGTDANGTAISFADASIYKKDEHFTKLETINGKQMWAAEGHHQPDFKQK